MNIATGHCQAPLESRMFILLLPLLTLAARPLTASPVLPRASAPTVNLSYGAFQGYTDGEVDAFLGMPFAEPPVGNLRFNLPQAPTAFDGIQQAVSFGPACPQQGLVLPESAPSNLGWSPPSISIISEDCLSINIFKPSSASAGDNLPVVFWIFGGGFELGDSALNPGTTLVERSITLGEPIVFVSHNYRLSALGFLGGTEVKEAGVGNLGLRDQRFAMQWVNQYISEFGGDPSKVTIWGESAGAYSVAAHLIWNGGNTEGLFRGAIMESGSPIPLQDISEGQPYYDQLVEDTGCSGTADTLDCLRDVPYETLLTAVALSPSIFAYQSLDLAWEPRIDGDILTQGGPEYLMSGQYAKVPIITGDCDDEGTLFSLGNLNVTTDDEFLTYINTYYLTNITSSQLASVGEAYPADPLDGSPFETGLLNILTSQNKRLAAFQGDWMWQAPRRLTLQYVSQTQDAWAYLYQRNKAVPYLGSFHSSDLDEFFTAIDYVGTDIIINFANNLNPNAPEGLAPGVSPLSEINWEQWGSNPSAPPLLTFMDPTPSVEITTDTFRADAMTLLNNLAMGMN